MTEPLADVIAGLEARLRRPPRKVLAGGEPLVEWLDELRQGLAGVRRALPKPVLATRPERGRIAPGSRSVRGRQVSVSIRGSRQKVSDEASEVFRAIRSRK